MFPTSGASENIDQKSITHRFISGDHGVSSSLAFYISRKRGKKCRSVAVLGPSRVHPTSGRPTLFHHPTAEPFKGEGGELSAVLNPRRRKAGLPAEACPSPAGSGSGSGSEGFRALIDDTLDWGCRHVRSHAWITARSCYVIKGRSTFVARLVYLFSWEIT